MKLTEAELGELEGLAANAINKAKLYQVFYNRRKPQGGFFEPFVTCSSQRILALISCVREMRAALEYYSTGAKPSEKYPRDEFGCGCCAGSCVEKAGEWERDYKLMAQDVQGMTARQALEKCIGEAKK